MHAGKFHNGGGGGGFSFGTLARSFSNIQGSFSVGSVSQGRGSIQGEILAAVNVFRPKPKVRQPPPPPPIIQPVGILNDIIQNVVGGFTGGQVRDINAQPQSGISNVLNDIILGATTSRQERAATGTFRTGDLGKILERDVRGRVGPGSPSLPGAVFPLQGLPTFPTIGGVGEIFNLAASNFARGPIGMTGMANGLSLVGGTSCPVGAQSFPPGTCLLDFQWEDAGGPRGFEMIGRNEDGRAILRKRGRRRRRHGLTKTQMGQVSWACNLPPNCRKEVLHGIVHG